MRRRDFIILVVGAMGGFPFAARAQQKAMPVVGYLGGGSPGLFVAAFRKGLSETGYVEGKNVVIEYRWAEFHYDRLPALAADLVSRKVDVIAAPSSLSARAANNATSTIPIVFVGGDPIEQDLVAGLARPGGNLTGFSLQVGKLMPKRLDLVSELVSQAGIIALLVNPNYPIPKPIMRDVQDAARAKGLQLNILKAAPIPRLNQPSRNSSNCISPRSSSAPIRSSAAGAGSSSRWPHATPFRRSTAFVKTSWPAA